MLLNLETTWRGMVQRCHNKNTDQYMDYGGRGIKVCERWRTSVVNFIRDMWPKPRPEMSIDRIDVNGNYEPQNCRWSTQQQQCWNTRRSRTFAPAGMLDDVSVVPVDYGVVPTEPPLTNINAYPALIPPNEEKCMAQLAVEHGLTYHCLQNRVDRGATIEEALSKPLSKRGGDTSLQKVEFDGGLWTIKELAEKHGQQYKTVCARLDQLGWSMEQALGLALKPARVPWNKQTEPLTPEQEFEKAEMQRKRTRINMRQYRNRKKLEAEQAAVPVPEPSPTPSS